MRVLHLVGGSLNGGAGRAAIAIHQSMRNEGIHSFIISSGDEKQIDDVKCLGSGILGKARSYVYRGGERALLNWQLGGRDSTLFSPGRFGNSVKKISKKADIINLHWINGGGFTVPDLTQIDAQIVWTLHDMWPFTGGCHYSLNCDKYQETCGYCPAINSQVSIDLSTKLQARKAAFLGSNTSVVAVSNWLAQEAKKSTIFKHSQVRVIPNVVDTNIFYPENRNNARKRLGLNQERPIVLFGHASNSWLKGSDILAKALNILGPNRPFDLITFGNSANQDSKFSDKHFGFINDDDTLRLLYCASNVFVTPARQEAFGRSITEAIACGTPVVAFSGSGPDDIIVHKKTGYLAESMNAYDLATGISDMLAKKDAVDDLCVNHIRETFSAKRVAKSYIELYNEKVSSGRG